MKSASLFIRFGCTAAVLFGATSRGQASLYDGSSYLAPGSPLPADFVTGPTSPGKWGPAALGTGATVTWSIMSPGVSVAAEGGAAVTVDLASFMPAGFLAEIQAAFAAWSAVADINFVQVADNGLAFNAAGALGDIRIGAHVFDGAFGTLAHGFFPPANGDTAAGDIHFDSDEDWDVGFAGPGFSVFQVMAHELGHAIGLGHTGVPNSLMNPIYTEAFSGPQADDIAGARFLYGDASVPEASTWVAGLSLAFGGFGLWRARRTA